MKVICNARKLTDAFMLAASVAPARSPKEILQNVKMTAENGTMKLTATDCEVSIEVRIADVETPSGGSVLLPVAKTTAILRENTDETIEIEVDGSKAVIRAARSRYQLLTESPDEFPTFNSAVSGSYHEMSARLLATAIRRTVYAADDDSSRYALGGVNLEADDQSIIAVGTDGRRLATHQGPATAVGGHVIREANVIVPSRAAKLVERALNLRGDDLVRITASLNDIVFETSQCVIYSRIIEGRFPKWRQVLPKCRTPSVIRVVNGLFLAAVRQASIATSQDSQGIDITFTEGEIKLEAVAPEIGESSVLMIADTDMENERVTLKVDHRFLREFCSTLDPEAVLAISVDNETTPMHIQTDDGYQYVIMPMARDR